MDERQFENLQKKFDNQANFVSKDILKIKDRVDKIDAMLKSGKEIDRLNKAISNALNFSEKKFSGLLEEMSKFNVRKIDLNKLESKLIAFKNEMDKFEEVAEDVKQIKENFIKFRKKALTKYNFSRLEKWIKEIESELMELISIKDELSKLSLDSKTRLSKIEAMLEKHSKIINKLRRKDYRDVKKCENKLMKHIDTLNENIKQNQNEISKAHLKIKNRDKQLRNMKRGLKKPIKKKKQNFFKKIKKRLHK